MTTINTTDELIKVLREDEAVRSAVRREILTEELVALPGRFETMLETQNSMLETQNSILEDLKGIREEQKSLREDTNALLKTQNSILEDLKGIRGDIKHLRDMRTDDYQAMHRFRGNYAADAARTTRVGIAQHFSRLRNMRQVRCEVLSTAALDDWIDKNPHSLAPLSFDDNDLDHFSEADLVVGVKRRRGPEPEFYIVVEASYTGDEIRCGPCDSPRQDPRSSDRTGYLRRSRGR